MIVFFFAPGVAQGTHVTTVQQLFNFLEPIMAKEVDLLGVEGLEDVEGGTKLGALGVGEGIARHGRGLIR